MKKLLLIFAAALAACAGNSQTENNDPNKQRIADKNRQTATLNEVTSITQTAQKLEKEGRAMDTYRSLVKADGVQQCGNVMADEQKQVQELADRITKLPAEYNSTLSPIVGDLNECVSCSKTAADSCVKARASINSAIKQIYK